MEQTRTELRHRVLPGVVGGSAHLGIVRLDWTGRKAAHGIRSVSVMNVEFISGFAVVSPDVEASCRLYVDTLGLPLTASEGSDYTHSENVSGAKHFGVWPLGEAAQACFGTSEWPADRVVPQASIEFDVESAAAVSAAAGELEALGYQLLHPAREEPWGQTVARLLSDEGLIVGISYIPQFHA